MRFGGIAAMGDFWRVVREFNPEGIEREATAHLDLWLVGEPESGKRTLAEALMGAEAGSWVHGPFRFVDVDYQQGQLPQIDSPDLIVLVARLDRDLAEQARQAATIFRRRLRVPPLLVLTRADSTQRSRDERNAAYRAFSFVSHLKMAFVDTRDHREVQETVGPMLLEGVPSLRTALARQIPSLRRPVADQIIAETCRVNAQ
ncbi:MAG: GTPase domain-containing protein, partial [Chloroflexota bacterium]